MRLTFVLLCLSVLLTACGGPRTTMMEPREARSDFRPLRVKVVAVYDNRQMGYTRELNVSHVIDVDVLEGPQDVVGEPLALPFDRFYVAAPPPRVGDVVTITPASWVLRRASGQTRGYGEQ